uniref:Uncharacterized protein n=1 Tax=Paramoeba aestuarina TaxID=180227 RepID=A0A7S4KP25_9EUKA|mmetsp:Transcript_22538/g.35032  ORF Transcript_22538/g.35032 Transcript_22538/m.35032 type:complete len:254 (+) Transcript_22538:70-831(+)
MFATDGGWYKFEYRTIIMWEEHHEIESVDCKGDGYLGLREFNLVDTRYWVKLCGQFVDKCDYSKMTSEDTTWSEDRFLPVTLLCNAMGLEDWGFRVKVAFFSTILASFFSLGSLYPLVMNARTGRFTIPLLVFCTEAFLFSLPAWVIFLWLKSSVSDDFRTDDYETELFHWKEDWALILSIIACPLLLVTLLCMSLYVWLNRDPVVAGIYNKMIDDLELMNTVEFITEEMSLEDPQKLEDEEFGLDGLQYGDS